MHRLCLRSLNATSSSHLTTISCCTYKELILGKKTVNLIAYNCLSDKITLSVGVLQGVTLASFLFDIVIDYIFVLPPMTKNLE